MPLTPEKQALAAAAEDPRAEHRQAETERTIAHYQELIAGQAVRKFCVEQAVTAACHNPGVDAEKLTEAFYRFMTADLSRLN